MGFFTDDLKIIEKNEDEEIAYLLTCDYTLEAEMLTGLLRDAGIPCMAKDRFAGGYVRVIAGGSNFGTDIYVARPRLEEARELVAAYSCPGDGDASVGDNNTENPENPENHAGKDEN